MHLIRTERRTFSGPAAFLADDGQRAEMDVYFADLARPFTGGESGSVGSGSVGSGSVELSGHSYGEMAEELLAAVVSEAEPVDLLVLVFSIHDMWPGRATATFLSHLCPGTPLSFAICDQGSAGPFTALRVIRDYDPRRALLIVVEQAALPYDSVATPPLEHRGVAMLYGEGDGPRVTGLRQHQGVEPSAVAGLVSVDIAELSAGCEGVRVVLSDSLAAVWAGRPDHVRVPAGQPTTGVWWYVVDALSGGADLVVWGDYDADLGYLCLSWACRASDV
jgi:hypothetical protein